MAMAKKYLVARNINGISLNNYEILLDSDGNIAYFDNVELAMEFIESKGFSDEEIESYKFMCERHISTNTSYILCTRNNLRRSSHENFYPKSSRKFVN